MGGLVESSFCGHVSGLLRRPLCVVDIGGTSGNGGLIVGGVDEHMP